MLQATRLRSQYPERQQHQQQRRHKASAGGSRYCCRPGPKLFLLFAALGSAIGDRTGGGGGSSSHRSPPPPSPSAFFFGRGSGSSSRDSAPPVPETLSLGDKLRSFGDRFRRDGGADGLEGGGGSRISSKRSGSSSSSSSSSRKAMAEGGAKGRDDGVAEGAANGQRKSNGGNSFIAGGLAGSISTTVTCPIEVVKTQLQGSTVKKGSNAFSIAASIFKTEGPRGFFRGLPPGLVGIIPARSTYFFAYSKSKEFWTDKARLGNEHRDLTEILCGVTAGIVKNTITNSIWMLLADTATGQVAYGGYGEAIKAIWRDEGGRGFYKGMSASYWGCSEGCLYFVLYERIKRRLRHRQNEERAMRGLPPTDTLPPAYLFASSAFSKMCATITTYPHEVMRTRLREQSVNGVFKYTGMWQSLILVAKEEGRRGLYAGMGTHVVRVVPNMAIMMMSYELISDWMRRRDAEKEKGFNTLLSRPTA